MLLFGVTPITCSMKCPIENQTHLLPRKSTVSLATRRYSIGTAVASLAAATLLFSTGAIAVAAPAQSEETLENIPQTLDSVCSPEQNCKKSYKIQRPKSRKAETCTGKCVTTCIQGGFGSPGEGPFNIRRPLVVFKDGFRSRKYCLSECSDICNLIGDGDDGQ